MLANVQRHDLTRKRCAGLPIGTSGISLGKRSMAGAPGRAMAGLPGNRLVMRSAAGPDSADNPNLSLIPSVCSPRISALIHKMYAPLNSELRFPDNNLIPCVNIRFSDYVQYTIGSNCPPNPVFLLLPARGTGTFLVGAAITVGEESRFLPHSSVPESRRLSNYTYVRNTHTRVILTAGTISTTFAALSGTFNAASFYDVRDFTKFDASEYSTLCIKTGDYVQGIPTIDGIVLASGPEMVGPLKAIKTTSIDTGGFATNFTSFVTNSHPSPGSVVFDYFTPSGRDYGLITNDTLWDITLNCKPTDALAKDELGIYIASITMTSSTVDISGNKVDNIKTTDFNIFGGAVTEGGFSSYAANNLTLNNPGIGVITKIQANVYLMRGGTAPDVEATMYYTLRARNTFDVGNHGPGLIATALSLSNSNVITLQIQRSMEGMPSGTLLPDLKADTASFYATTPDELASVISELGRPDSAYKRVYSIPSFNNSIAITCGMRSIDISGATDGSSIVEGAERAMAGPVSDIISSLTPIASMIPEIGPIASAVGNTLSGVTRMLGLSGPVLEMAGPYLYGTEHAIIEVSPDSPITPEGQLSPNDIGDMLADQIDKISTATRYRMVAAGYPIEDTVYVANLAIVSGTRASMEYLIVSKHPFHSYSTTNNTVSTTYRHFSISWQGDETSSAWAYLSDDFFIEENHTTPGGATAVLNAMMAIALSRRSGHYVTLPVPGTCSGPSLGLPLLIACLGIIDPDTVYSGGISTSQDGTPIVTEIAGLSAKSALCESNKTKLVCGGDPELAGVVNHPGQGTSTLLISAGAMPIGYPVVEAQAIIVRTLAEALFVGLTMSDLPNSRRANLNTQIADIERKAAAKREAQESGSKLLEKGLIAIPDSFAAAFDVPPGNISIDKFSEINPASVLNSLMPAGTKAAARANLLKMPDLILEALQKEEFPKANNLMASLGDYIMSQKTRGIPKQAIAAPTNSGIFFGKSLRAAVQRKGNAKSAARKGLRESTLATKAGAGLTTIAGPQSNMELSEKIPLPPRPSLRFSRRSATPTPKATSHFRAATKPPTQPSNTNAYNALKYALNLGGSDSNQ